MVSKGLFLAVEMLDRSRNYPLALISRSFLKNLAEGLGNIKKVLEEY